MNLFRKKPTENQSDYNLSGLKRCLTAFDLIFLGIGAIIGAGIFVLTGIAAATRAGPAIIISYLISGAACAFSALSYAELAASVGGCGSAYNYAYTGMGEMWAWIIGWDLLLEYTISVSAVSVGWSSYVNDLLSAFHIHIPIALRTSPLSGGIIDLPALFIIVFLTILLCIGAKTSTRINNVMVLIKLCVIALFILIALFNINPAYWHPFNPFGWQGIIGGAGLIFFAYIGFDAVSTTAEEAINPQRDLPIGIVGSLIICTLIYIIVSALLTGIAPYTSLNVSSPISNVLLNLGYRFAASIISVGAIAGLTTVLLVMYFGLTRIFLAMARDGLLPYFFASLNKTTQSPVRIILTVAVFISLLCSFLPLKDLVELVNVGTLFAFITVCSGVIMLRITAPLLPRPFKTPGSPITPVLGIITCAYLIASLPGVTLIRFLVWMAIGFIFYFAFSQRHSLLNKTTGTTQEVAEKSNPPLKKNSQSIEF